MSKPFPIISLLKKLTLLNFQLKANVKYTTKLKDQYFFHPITEIANLMQRTISVMVPQDVHRPFHHTLQI